jgi:hypothetical protein
MRCFVDTGASAFLHPASHPLFKNIRVGTVCERRKCMVPHCIATLFPVLRLAREGPAWGRLRRGRRQATAAERRWLSSAGRRQSRTMSERRAPLAPATIPPHTTNQNLPMPPWPSAQQPEPEYCCKRLSSPVDDSRLQQRHETRELGSQKLKMKTRMQRT